MNYKLVAIILSDEKFKKSTKLQSTLSIPKNKSLFSFLPTKIKTHTKIILLEENYIENLNVYKIIIVYDNYEYLKNIARRLTADLWPNNFLIGKLGSKNIDDEIIWKDRLTNIDKKLGLQNKIVKEIKLVKEKTKICPHCGKETVRQNRRNHFGNCINLIFGEMYIK